MDSGRLGRVLGTGARHAAKTLVGAVDAATAPSPRPVSPTGRAAPRDAAPVRESREQQTAGAPRPAPRGDGRHADVRTRGAAETRRGVAEGSRRFGRAVWEPAARLGGVLWLEVTGLFFGLFVLIAAGAAWRLRGGLHAGAQHGQFLLAVAMAALFAYFTLTSFVSASRRGRRR